MSQTTNLNANEILYRAIEGKKLSRYDVCCLMDNDSDLQSILDVASYLRDKFKPDVITYSRKVFINLVNLCRDACAYCTYKKEPSDPLVSMMTPEQVLAVAEAGKKWKCTEALFVTGERPEQLYPEARTWLKSVGHSSTIEYISEMSELVLRKTGLLPHTNAGSLTKKEMYALKKTNVSIGMMLESASERLTEKGNAHAYAPSKNPKLRIKVLQNAGDLKIPITTGLLVGIGETPEEIVDSLFVINNIFKKYGNIQEVIMQNFAPKDGTKMATHTAPSFLYFLRCVAVARIVMPQINIQVPPNLSPSIFGTYIDAGINDWGGISPVTIDHVNPEFAWPSIKSVQLVTESKGHRLRARLPVYPEFLVKDGFISDDVRKYIKLLSDNGGLVAEGLIN